MKQKPVAWIRSGDDQLSLVKGKDDGYMIWQPLYTTPQIKELSDEEIDAVYHEVWNSNKWSDVEGIDIEKFARAILKKANEK